MNNIKSNKIELSPKQREELLGALKARFEKNMNRHKGLDWAKVQARLEANAERHLKSSEEMGRLFGDASKAIGQTTRFFKRCKFFLDELRPNYPSEFRHGYATALEALRALSKEGARRRYLGGVPRSVWKTLAKELRVIKELKCAAYFLTVHDIVRYAKSKGILCQGRGSAANSLVCYSLGITAVSPERANGGLFFERSERVPAKLAQSPHPRYRAWRPDAGVFHRAGVL